MVAATSSTAAAGYWYGGVWYGSPVYGPAMPYPGPYHPGPFYPYYNPGPAIVGSIFNSILGVIPRAVPAPRIYAGTNPHVAWCMRYRTYNPATNTYFVRRGVAKACVSPYPYPFVY
jgi:hypothetical protein